MIAVRPVPAEENSVKQKENPVTGNWRSLFVALEKHLRRDASSVISPSASPLNGASISGYDRNNKIPKTKREALTGFYRVFFFIFRSFFLFFLVTADKLGPPLLVFFSQFQCSYRVLPSFSVNQCFFFLPGFLYRVLPGFSFDVTGFYRVANRVQSHVKSLPSFYRVFISIFKSYWVFFYRVHRLEQVPCDHYRVFTGFFV